MTLRDLFEANAANDSGLFGDARMRTPNGEQPKRSVDAALAQAQDPPASGIPQYRPCEYQESLTQVSALYDWQTRKDTGELGAWRIDWPTFWETDHREEAWLVEPILAEGRSHSIDSKPEGGKSRLCQEIAFGVATGRPVLHRSAGLPLTVVYLDMEMTEDDLAERAGDFGYGPEDDLSRLHYILLPSIPSLDTAEGGKLLLDYVTDTGAKAVFIDTTARVLEGPENDADTLRDFHRHTGQPLKAAGVTWVRADHLGKDETRGARGTSAKRDDVDIVWQLTKGDGSIELRAKKRRVRWVPERVALNVVDDPHLHHELAEYSWPAGTKDAAKKLDQAAVPLDATRRVARAALKAAGLSVANAVLTSALRWRRAHAEQVELPRP